MRRIFALLLLVSLLLSFQPAQAQAETSLSSLAVKIWPEYDKPSVLVIYQAVFSPQTALPSMATFRIPKAAGKPLVVAVGATPTTITDQNIQYSLEDDGEWIKVVIQMTGPALQLEYYDPSISIDGRSRSYTYTWPGDYAVAAFSLEAQQPFDASEMKFNPALPTMTAISDLTYYSNSFGALEKGQEFSLEIGYQKASDALSVSFMSVQPSAPVDDTTPGRVSLDTYLPWLVGAFGVLMIAGGVYYYIRGSARPRASVRRRHASREEAGGGQVYCSQCGTRGRSGDRFCRTCGSRIRTESDD